LLSASPMSNPPKVLVAEDDEWMRRLIVEALQKDGYDVTEVSDGGQALERLAIHPSWTGDEEAIDLLVSDVRMPTCSGLQVLERLRGAQRWTPVVLITAFGDDATRTRARSLGAALIDKPFPLVELRALAARLLRRLA
jgi:CheY-like chemotaxis protein